MARSLAGSTNSDRASFGWRSGRPAGVGNSWKNASGMSRITTPATLARAGTSPLSTTIRSGQVRCVSNHRRCSAGKASRNAMMLAMPWGGTRPRAE